MANRETTFIEITPEVLLKAYACGIFPMAESAEDPALYWLEPEKRGVIPLDRFHMPGRLARTVRSDRFTVTINRDFDARLLDNLSKNPEEIARIPYLEYAREAGSEGIEMVMWLIARGACLRCTR